MASNRLLSSSEITALFRNRGEEKQLEQRLARMTKTLYSSKDSIKEEMQTLRDFGHNMSLNSGWSPKSLRPEFGENILVPTTTSRSPSTSQTKKGGGQFQRPWAYAYSNSSHNKIYKELDQVGKNSQKTLGICDQSPKGALQPIQEYDNESLSPKLADNVYLATQINRVKNSWNRVTISDLTVDKAFHLPSDFTTLPEKTKLDKSLARQVSTVSLVTKAKSIWLPKADRNQKRTENQPLHLNENNPIKMPAREDSLNDNTSNVMELRYPSNDSAYLDEVFQEQQTEIDLEAKEPRLKRVAFSYKGVHRAKTIFSSRRSLRMINEEKEEHTIKDDTFTTNPLLRNRPKLGRTISQIETNHGQDFKKPMKERRRINSLDGNDKSVFRKKAKTKSRNNLFVDVSSMEITPKSKLASKSNAKQKALRAIDSQKFDNGTIELDGCFSPEDENKKNKKNDRSKDNVHMDEFVSDISKSSKHSESEHDAETVSKDEPLDQGNLDHTENIIKSTDGSESRKIAAISEPALTSKNSEICLKGSRKKSMRPRRKSVVRRKSIAQKEKNFESIADEINKSHCLKSNTTALPDVQSVIDPKSDDVDLSLNAEYSDKEESIANSIDIISDPLKVILHPKASNRIAQLRAINHDVINDLFAISDNEKQNTETNQNVKNDFAKDETGEKAEISQIQTGAKVAEKAIGKALERKMSLKPKIVAVRSVITCRNSFLRFETERKHSLSPGHRIDKGDHAFTRIAKTLLHKMKVWRRFKVLKSSRKSIIELSGKNESPDNGAISRERLKNHRQSIAFTDVNMTEKNWEQQAKNDNSELNGITCNPRRRRSIMWDKACSTRIIQTFANNLYENEGKSDDNDNDTGKSKSNDNKEKSQEVRNEENRNGKGNLKKNRERNGGILKTNDNEKNSSKQDKPNEDENNNNSNNDNTNNNNDASSGKTVKPNRGLQPRLFDANGNPRGISVPFHRGIRLPNYVSPQLRYKTPQKKKAKRGLSIRWHASVGVIVNSYQPPSQPLDTVFSKDARQRALTKMVEDNHAKGEEEANEVISKALRSRIEDFLDSVEPFCQSPTKSYI